MAQKTIYAADLSLNYAESKSRDFDTSGLGTINWAKLYYSQSRSGATPSSGSSQSISGNWKTITFKHSNNDYYTNTLTNIRLLVDYTASAPPPAGEDPPPPANPVCTAPTSVSISPSGAAAYPDEPFTVSWSGATGPISSYGLYISANGADYVYYYQTGNTNTSYQVTAPAAGNTWYIKIKSLAANYTNDSHVSAQTVQINSVVGTISPPDSPKTASDYYGAGATIRFSWGASAAGTNNTVTGYQVRHATGGGGWALADVGQTLYYDIAAPAAGVAKHFQVMALGERINTEFTPTVTAYTYSAPTAPTSVLVSPTTAFTGDSVTLYWGGANAGVGVGISGYQYLMNGVWKGGIAGTSTTITAPAVAGTYPIRIEAVGDVSGYVSGPSAASAILTVINPISTGTLNTTGITMDGSQITITIHPAKSTFSHKVVWYSANSGLAGNTITNNVGMGLTDIFGVPLAWNNAYPNSNSGTAYVRLETYDGATKVGEITYSYLVLVPAFIVPSLGSLAAVIVPNGVPVSVNRYVQNYSKTQLTANGAAGSYGSTIASYQITGEGYSAANSSVTWGPLAKVGNNTFTATVTDTRGRKASASVTIVNHAYSKPSLKKPLISVGIYDDYAYRSDAGGTRNQSGAWARLKAESIFSSIDGQNVAVLEGRVYMKGATPGAWATMVSLVQKVLGGGALLATKGYEAEIRITDLLNTYSVIVQIPTESVLLHGIDEVIGAGIGKYCEHPGYLDVAWPIKSEGYDVLTTAAAIALIAYPVGAIYMSLTATSPATLFGGTWAEIESGTFLVAAGSGYAAGATGGAATVTLTESQMPGHTHALRGTLDTTPEGYVMAAKNATVGTDVSTNSMSEAAGGGNAHENLPPYYAVYMWRRTA